MMAQQTSLPKPIALRLEKIVQACRLNPNNHQKQTAYSNLLNIIASMISASGGSLRHYDTNNGHSTIICDYSSHRTGILRQRLPVGTRYDERKYTILYDWLNNTVHSPLMLHVDELPVTSSERREFQSYGIFSSLYLPVTDIGNNFSGYIKLHETRFKRTYTQQELADLMQAIQYLKQVMML